MNIREIYESAVEMGIFHDPRGIDTVRKELAGEKKFYEKITDEADKKIYDKDRLINPYSDSRILFDGGIDMRDKEIKKVMVGVDIDTAELLLADRLNQKAGQGGEIGLVIAHHPLGKALASLAEVMSLQSGYMETVGIPPHVAVGIMTERIGVVSRSVSGSNHYKAVDAARALGIPLMCVHTPADNMATSFLQRLAEEKQPETVGDFITLLKEIPEYAKSAEHNAPPRILAGRSENRLGKIYIDFTGGTSGSEDMFERLSAAGISTVVVMHMGEKHLESAKKQLMNVVLAGHISSDSLGLNIMLDAFTAKGIEIVPVSGLIRVERNKK